MSEEVCIISARENPHNLPHRDFLCDLLVNDNLPCIFPSGSSNRYTWSAISSVVCAPSRHHVNSLGLKLTGGVSSTATQNTAVSEHFECAKYEHFADTLQTHSHLKHLMAEHHILSQKAPQVTGHCSLPEKLQTYVFFSFCPSEENEMRCWLATCWLQQEMKVLTFLL